MPPLLPDLENMDIYNVYNNFFLSSIFYLKFLSSTLYMFLPFSEFPSEYEVVTVHEGLP